MSSNQKDTQNYGKLSSKEPEVTLWEFLCVDMIGPYKINRKGKEKNME